MKCPKCGSEDISLSVNVSMVMPAKYAHKLSKTALRSKDIELWSASWDTAFCICGNCGYSWKGC